MKFYMFRTILLSIIRSFSLYTQKWYMSYKFVDSFPVASGWNSVPSWSCSIAICVCVLFLFLRTAITSLYSTNLYSTNLYSTNLLVFRRGHLCREKRLLTSPRLSVFRMYEPASHWTDVRDIWWTFINICPENLNLVEIGQKYWALYITTHAHLPKSAVFVLNDFRLLGYPRRYKQYAMTETQQQH